MENNQDRVILNGESAANENSQPAVNNPQNGAPVNPCPICGTPYTYVCPKCGFSPYVGNKKAKKSIFTKWWFWLVAVLLMFGIMIGVAGCMIALFSTGDSSASDYKTTALCKAGNVEINLIPEESYRDNYEIILELEVKNTGDESVSFYPTKVLFDGTKGEARCNFSEDDWGFSMAFDWESYYAADDSIILKPGKTHTVTLTFESEYDDDGETLIEDLRQVLVLDFNFNVANPETLEVKDTTQVTFNLNDIKANQKYYEYE